MSEVYVIAEIGVNHNNDIDLAKNMILEAKKCGANAVKFQTYNTDRLALADTPKVNYQKRSGDLKESHYSMLRKLELSHKDHELLFNFCKVNNVDFISTPYDVESAKFLLDLGVGIFKTASADITDFPLHAYIASTNKKCLVSTGMSTLSEVGQLVELYKTSNYNNFVFMHCVSNYPCTTSSLNLKAITTIKNKYKKNVGYSDHSVGILASSIAVALGASVIEKHFTLDKQLDGPDQAASCNPKEFSELVNAIRKVEIVLGDGIKVCQQEEMQMREVSRKSLVASRDIKRGELLSANDFVLKRPGTGLSYLDIEKIKGKKVKKDIPINYKISLEDLE